MVPSAGPDFEIGTPTRATSQAPCVGQARRALCRRKTPVADGASPRHKEQNSPPALPRAADAAENESSRVE